jgi:hypothetical protein
MSPWWKAIFPPPAIRSWNDRQTTMGVNSGSRCDETTVVRPEPKIVCSVLCTEICILVSDEGG